MFKIYKHNDYVKMYGLYYIYMHVYKGRILYIGKGSRARGRDFANRSVEYKEYINKIGKNNMTTYIIEESLDQELMIQLEMLVHEILLDEGYKLFSKPEKGKYGCLKGRIFSEETKAKLSSARKCKLHIQETKEKIGNERRGSISNLRKNIVQLTLDNTFVEEHTHIRKLDDLGFQNSAIVSCCKGKRNKHKGYTWMYKDDYLKSYAN